MIFIYLIVGVIAGFIGAGLAGSRGLSAPLMGFVCFLFPIGLLFLAFVPEKKNQLPLVTAAGEFENSEKWKTLKLVDADIAEAAAIAKKLGPGYENTLASQYLSLGDKAYLDAILEKLGQQWYSAQTSETAALTEIDGKYFNQEGEYVCLTCRAANVLGETSCAHCGVQLV